jgi:glycosyltransferase involved in cell wall biosynthesis
MEIIITDDCSNDNTLEIIKKFQNKDNRIKLYVNEKNLGFKKNFEKAISLCNGDYICLADQDDIWKLNKVEKFIKNITTNILIYSDAILINKNSKNLNKLLIGEKNFLVKGKCNKVFLLDNCVSGNTLMFKKELVKHILPIPESISYHDIWIAFIASTIGTITYTEEPMTFYRRYNEQITATKKTEYKSFLKRFKYKETSNINFAKNSLRQNKEFLKLSFLDDDVRYLIILLNDHYINFKKGFFNIKLYKFLKENKDEIFATKQPRKHNRYVIKTSMKLKLHKLIFFSI